MTRTPVAIYDVDSDLILALEGKFGPPIDSYLMGWQVWLVDIDDDTTLEFRVHPPAGFEQPANFDHHDLWTSVIEQLSAGVDDLSLGSEQRTLADVFTLMEVFPAHNEDVTVADIVRWASDLVGIAPRASGLVDHAGLGGKWRRARKTFDLPAALRAALDG